MDIITKTEIDQQFQSSFEQICSLEQVQTRSQYPGFCKYRLFLDKTSSRHIYESLAFKVTTYLKKNIITTYIRVIGI